MYMYEWKLVNELGMLLKMMSIWSHFQAYITSISYHQNHQQKLKLSPAWASVLLKQQNPHGSVVWSKFKSSI